MAYHIIFRYEKIQQRRKFSTTKFTSWLGYSMSATYLLAQSLDIVMKQNIPHSCLFQLRNQVFTAITSGNHTVSLEGTDLRVAFVNRSYSKGYAVKALTVTGNFSKSTLVGYSSHLQIQLVNKTIPQNLKSTPQQQSCSGPCAPGQFRKFLDLVNFPCCWKCEVCAVHHFSSQSNQDTCQECRTNETSTNDNIGCVPTSIEYLEVTSISVILGLTFSGVNLVVITIMTVLCITMSNRPVIKAADPSFLGVFLLGLVFGNFGLIFTLMKPSDGICEAEFILNTMFFTLVTSSLCLRAIKIYQIFSAANDFRKPRFHHFCTRKGQMIMNTIILIVNLTITGFVLKVGNVWKFNMVQEQVHTEFYVMCTSNNWLTSLPFIIPAFLFLLTLYYAFIMRSFPHNFRETFSIFVATLIAIFSSVMFLTGYELSPPKNKSVLRAIMIYTLVVALIASILGPKFVVLVLRYRNGGVDEREEISATLRKYCNKISITSKISISSKVAISDGGNNDGYRRHN